MNIKIICYKENKRRNQITKAINILNSIQNYFYYKIVNSDLDVCLEKKVDWEKFRESYENNDETYNIFITEKTFDDNWFSHEENNYSIISTSDWENIFAPPSLRAYLMYQIVQASVNFEADLSENMEMRMLHDKAEGCMFDFCYDKVDIKLGMISGTICPQCRSVLVRYGIEERALKAAERILQYVRAESIGKPAIFNENEAFIIMRFSNNDENDHAYKYGIQPALKELNIKGIRADSTVISGQLLSKVRQSIEKCRFIIAKIDSNNLNVYFELGLAMGLDKDVLLISEDKLILQLPTDLKNWECLTYPEGDYDELKRRIKKYYQDNYHY